MCVLRRVLPSLLRGARPAEQGRRRKQRTVDERAHAALRRRGRRSPADRRATQRARPALRRRSSAPAKRAPARHARRKPSSPAWSRTLEGIAARGQLTAPRLAPLWLTLERNREWWTTHTTGPTHAPHRASTAPSSSGSTTRARASRSSRSATSASSTRSGPSRDDDRLARPARRAAAARRPSAPAASPGSTTSPSAAAAPPWVSRPRAGHRAAGARARGDAARPRGRGAPGRQRGARRLRDARRRRACACRPATAPHYAQYSFAPGLRILNGFIQSLVGLYDYAQLTGDPTRAGAVRRPASARRAREVPTYDTGAWSLYSRGTIDARVRPQLPRAAARLPASLCKRTDDRVYCDAEPHFASTSSSRRCCRVAHRAAARRHAPARCASGCRRSRASTCGSRAAAGSSTSQPVGRGRLRDARRCGWAVPRKRGRLRRCTLARARPRRQRRHAPTGDVEVLEARSASAVALPRFDGAADDPLHGQGRRRQDVRRRRHRPPLRRRRAAHARALDRSGALARRVAARRPVGAEPTEVGDGLWAQQVQAQDELERHWSAVQELARRRARRARRRPDRRRGADRPARRRRAVQPAAAQAPRRGPASGTRSSSTARRPARRCGCCRSPTPRAGGSTRCSGASARCWPPRARSRARSSTSRCPTSACSPRSSGSCSNLIAMHEILRDRARASRCGS